MSILIPGALPEGAIAPALASELEKTAPGLIEIFRRATPEPEHLPPAMTGCTPAEVWLLRNAGFTPGPGLSCWASGLGPLLHPQASTDAPVWLAEFAHIALGTDQVNLIPLPDLQISQADDDALFAGARDALLEYGLTVQRLTPGRWQLHAPAGWLEQARSASPATVAQDGLLGWWNHDPALRPWRRALNEVQMAWHEHPANDARAERGLAPINGLWLYGGAKPWPRPAHAPVTQLACLEEHAQAEDWGRWLQNIKTVETALAGWAAQTRSAEPLILTGRDRLVQLHLAPRPLWQRWRPVSKNEWKNWWQPRD